VSTRWRDAIRAAVPAWLREGLAEKIGYSIGVQLDALDDWTTFAVKSRFPLLYGNQSLPTLGRDRKLPRGVVEDDATYAARLREWLTTHSTRGNPYTFLEALRAYWGPGFTAELVYNTAPYRTYTMDLAGDITRSDQPGFVAPVALSGWARWWLFPVGTSLDASGASGLWGALGNQWGELGLWGTGLSKGDIDRLRLIPSLFNSGHPIGRVVLVSGAQVAVL
jgi:hypothetical protein